MNVSLVIPTYNRTGLLRKCLLSVLSQSIQPAELVLSDDGSSEDILSGIQDLLEQADFRIKFVQQEDRGFRAARCRNNGVRQAEGEYIVCFDPDIVFSKHYLKTLVGAAREKRFVVGQVIRFTEAQNNLICREHILQGDYSSILTEAQKHITPKQYRKELLYSLLNTMKFRKQGPKLRSGLLGFFKDDFVRVNGFDEKFVGWGNEDDDLGVRFYAAGIRGKNPFRKDYAIHLYHDRFHSDERANKSYQKKRMKEINRSNFRCEYGYETHDSQEEITVKTLK
ncbi:MAG: glycosyltransferase [Desulfobacteraceae bacterium]|nr:glycosyltransferase [Desulfobacteraceae bacterium]